MIVTRHEFRVWVKTHYPEFYKWNSPLWSIEHQIKKNPPQWFARVRPVAMQRDGRRLKEKYWNWCDENMQGKLLCYYSDFENRQEWWGFTRREDITLWLLKWTG